MATIYIVEDDMNICEIEQFALKNAGYETKGFGTAAAFEQHLKEKLPDLIILDVMLPDKDGLEILKGLRMNKSTYKIPVIMITAKSTELDKVKGLDLGADDYMTKPFGVMELISRVKAMMRRLDLFEHEDRLTFEGIEMEESRHQVTVDGHVVELTFKEYELLKMLLHNAGIVLQRSQLLDRIWGIDYEGESRTLDMHIKTLRHKLGDKGALIQTVRNVGYTLNYKKED